MNQSEKAYQPDADVVALYRDCSSDGSPKDTGQVLLSNTQQQEEKETHHHTFESAVWRREASNITPVNVSYIPIPEFGQTPSLMSH